ncbi:AMP-binding protein [Gordonia sp. NB41Y]|uniref:class I adenylate-forming enzyme family protein n=1 Tax=Gordonia sp. NB41Y TaxID=875808 RepID=UPI0006B1A2D5|nr:AMP-binding protein [Gordonia sp. NB41Y]KOY49659.1 acyl-CoA synthetase [Gordonia sp. NB41Y]WLP92324.1 AMP-binding protein [Gordonia sp. NB41Y]
MSNPPHTPAPPSIGHGRRLHLEAGTALEMFEHSLARRPDDVAIDYFDLTLTWTQLDRASTTLAGLLIARGFVAGDRLALLLQNDPAFVIGLLATWKAGGIAALISPMSTTEELRERFAEYTPTALVALDHLYLDRARAALADGTTGVNIVLTVSPLDGQTVPDRRLFADTGRPSVPDTIDLVALVRTALVDPTGLPELPIRPLSPLDTAVLLSTSGTTGPPKAAQITHANLVFSAHVYREWTGVSGTDAVLGASPLFHVTGLVGGVMLSMLVGVPLVLTHRFHPQVIVDAIRRRRPGFMIAVITAFIALADESDATPEDLASLRFRLSGGAPIDPDTEERLSERLGGYIHNVYGLTESTSPTLLVPFGQTAPIDPETGVLSVGRPAFDTEIRIVDDEGIELPVGGIGELIISGPQIVRGYWRNPVATAEAFTGTGLRTGDIGFRDADGWFYVIDRKSALINASGFKVWPHEVERVLCTHPAVVEAAVVGIPDEYRGESVKAVVVISEPGAVSEAELMEYCRQNLAAYKYPREVELVGALPRTATGKLLRRKLM